MLAVVGLNPDSSAVSPGFFQSGAAPNVSIVRALTLDPKLLIFRLNPPRRWIVSVSGTRS